MKDRGRDWYVHVHAQSLLLTCILLHYTFFCSKPHYRDNCAYEGYLGGFEVTVFALIEGRNWYVHTVFACTKSSANHTTLLHFFLADTL